MGGSRTSLGMVLRPLARFLGSLAQAEGSAVSSSSLRTRQPRCPVSPETSVAEPVNLPAAQQHGNPAPDPEDACEGDLRSAAIARPAAPDSEKYDFRNPVPARASYTPQERPKNICGSRPKRSPRTVWNTT